MSDLLNERQKTHGDFRDNARISQALKTIMRNEPKYKYLTDVEKESLDMLALKIGRVLSGNPHLVQHWEDLEGYSKLVKDDCDA